MHVSHVQNYVIPAPKIAKRNPAWNDVLSFAWLVPKHVLSVPQHVEVWMQVLQNQQINVLKPAKHVPKPAVHVPKYVKSIQIWSIAENAQKHAGYVKRKVESMRQNAKLLLPEFLIQQDVV